MLYSVFQSPALQLHSISSFVQTISIHSTAFLLIALFPGACQDSASEVVMKDLEETVCAHLRPEHSIYESVL